MAKSNEKEATKNRDSDITFEITEHIGELSVNQAGWIKEVNMVSWNGKKAKYDIREWDPDHERMSRGLTFTKEEVEKLKEFLNELNI